MPASAAAALVRTQPPKSSPPVTARSRRLPWVKAHGSESAAGLPRRMPLFQPRTLASPASIPSAHAVSVGARPDSLQSVLQPHSAALQPRSEHPSLVDPITLTCA